MESYTESFLKFTKISIFFIVISFFHAAADARSNNFQNIRSLDALYRAAPRSPDPEVYQPQQILILVKVLSYPKPCDTRLLRSAMRTARFDQGFIDYMESTNCILVKTRRGHRYKLHVIPVFDQQIPKVVPLNKTVGLHGIYLYNSISRGPGIIVNGFTSKAFIDELRRTPDDEITD